MQAKCEWGFTAKPDFARICRELASRGAAVGRVTMKGEKPVTLVDMHSTAGRNVIRLNVHHAYVTGTMNRWTVMSGDHVQAVLALAPVKVEGFAATDMVVPVAPGISAAAPSAAPPATPVAPKTAWVGVPGEPGRREYLPLARFGIFCSDGSRSASFPTTYVSRETAERHLAQVDPARVRASGYFVKSL